ncbi:31982_t:CDS:2, partial [Racocetra persica]
MTDLGDSNFGLEENPSSDDFFIRQTKKHASTSKDTDAILLLITVLRFFAEATDLLGCSKYATISFMYSAITVIKQGLLLDKTLDIDFDSFEDVFDNDVICKDDKKYYMSNQQQINVSSNEAMLATLLDPQCKAFSFMSRSLKKKTIELLKAGYEEAQILYQTEKEKNNLQTNLNTLLASMFQNRTTSTASEKLFSDARNTMIAKRISLLPTTFEHL